MKKLSTAASLFCFAAMLFVQSSLIAQDITARKPQRIDDRHATPLVLVCGGDKVLMIDEKESDGDDLKIVWSWQAADVAAQIPKVYQKRLRAMDECKPVNGGKNLLIVSSAGAVLLLEKETKKCLFYAHVPAAHSADLLPDNKIVVALSNHPKGNSLEVYDISRPEQVLFKDELRSGHGAVWMPQRNRFYALGLAELREYSLKNWDTFSPELVPERKWTIPVKSGHDLSPRSANELLVSGHEGVRVFDIDKEEFRPFEALRSVPHVKSVNVDEKTGRLLYTKAEEQWWTFNIRLENPTKTLHIPDVKWYKARFFPVGD